MSTLKTLSETQIKKVCGEVIFERALVSKLFLSEGEYWNQCSFIGCWLFLVRNCVGDSTYICGL